MLYAVADPAHAIAEANEADNTASLAAFGPDLAIESAGVEHWGGSDVGLVTVIRNLGTTASPATTVAFYRDTITGTLAVSDTVPPSGGQRGDHPDDALELRQPGGRQLPTGRGRQPRPTRLHRGRHGQ